MHGNTSLAALISLVCVAVNCRGANEAATTPPTGTGCPGVADTSKNMLSSAAHTQGIVEQALPESISGTVVQTLSAGRYVYIEIRAGTGTVWVAALEEPVAKGNQVTCRPQILMEKFDSPSLKRTFDQVYFVESLKTSHDGAGMPANHPPVTKATTAENGTRHAASTAEIKLDVARADGGVTISELSAQSEKLAGTEVCLRAIVIKYNPDILGANWLRVKDSSGKRDLVVTTKSEVQVGETVLIRGRLERNVDLGSGYSYDIIIRNADVKIESPPKP